MSDDNNRCEFAGVPIEYFDKNLLDMGCKTEPSLAIAFRKFHCCVVRSDLYCKNIVSLSDRSCAAKLFASANVIFRFEFWNMKLHSDCV